jgi:hypothetical protein
MSPKERREVWLQRYLLAVGVLLLGQGAVSLLLDRAGAQLPPLLQAFVADPRHALVHVVWGLVMLAVGGARRHDHAVLAVVTLVFGVFYTGLGFLGVFLHYPFGLHLGPGEDVFHFVVGTSALILGARAVWRPTTADQPASRAV